MSKQLTGSCLCGGFKYMVENPSRVLFNCLCGMCRKSVGAACFSTFLIPRNELVLLETSTIASHKSSENVLRHFCTTCGCSTYGEDANHSFVAVCLGTVDGDLLVKKSGEAYAKYKAPWHQLYPGAPNSDEFEIAATLFKNL